jgi:hypothetical protein
MIRKPIKLKKKGQVIQVAFFLVFIFMIIFTLLLSKYILQEFNAALEDSGIQTTESRQSMVDMNVAFPTFDNAILMVVILLSIGMIITSFLIPSHPIFMVVNIFGVFFLCFLGMVLSNLYADIISNSTELAGVYGTFPKLNFIMNKLPWIAAILIFVISIVQYSRYRGENG